MIIKKPYAFLIKHFRLIHGLLFALLLFLVVKSLNIYTFFNNYAVNHSFLNQANLADTYVNISMYIVLILALLITFVIYFILSLKDKGNRIYLFMILYYIVLFIFFIYIHSIYEGLQEKYLDLESVRLFRDISLIALVPQIIFIFIIFGRTLGFNLKQFEFKKDLEEMQIDISDNEEVEVTFGNDTYKIARFFRKLLRLSKYFLLENKLFVIATASILIIAISIAAYSKVDFYQESYEENQEIQASFLWFKVHESYITDADINNVKIKEGKHYVLINVNVNNKSNSDYSLDRDTFRLQVNSELLIPAFSLTDKFNDIGDVFTPSTLKSGFNKDYIVAFEVDDEFNAEEYMLKIKNTVGETSHKDIILKPKYINKTVDMGTFKLPNTFDLRESILKNSVLEIDSFDIAEKFKEPYKYTINGVTKDGIYSIMPKEENKGSVLLIKFKTSLTLDESTYVSSKIKTPSDLYALYGIISYRYQGHYYNVKLNKVDVDYDIQNYSYFEIPKDVENANKIDLILLIRGIKYTINLK